MNENSTQLLKISANINEREVTVAQIQYQFELT